MKNLEESITDYVKNASSHEEAKQLANNIIATAEEARDDFLSEHCEYSGELTLECDCFSCIQSRKEAYAEKRYDEIRHGGL